MTFGTHGHTMMGDSLDDAAGFIDTPSRLTKQG
jgi:hypothetical protein